MRDADTTSVPVGFYDAALFGNPANSNLAGKTSTGSLDTMTAVGDPAQPYIWFAGILRVHGDDVEVTSWRVWDERSAGNAQYPGHGALKMFDRRTLPMDVRGN